MARDDEAPTDHAVVIGASIAGLLAAAALSGEYEQVTILERDDLPRAVGQRRAVPQGRHVHALLASGQRAIEQLLPGITDELLEAGALWCRSLSEVRFVIGGHELIRDATCADVLLASRPLVEGVVRRRVLALRNVAVCERRDVVGLVSSPSGGRVTGARVTRRGEHGDEQLDGDLIVAASGRSASVPGWLEQLGYPAPDEDLLKVDLRYVSRHLRLRSGALDGKLILIGPRPGCPRALALFAQEDERWIVTGAGYGPDDRPPTDVGGFLDFVASITPPDVFAAIEDAEPLDELAAHGFPANRRRRYERLHRFPEGLLVIGDAISSFNPLYGQGMSVAALEAVELRRCLQRGPHRLAQRFFRAAAAVAGPAWEMAIGSDLGLPEVAGHRSLGVRFANAYTERLLRVAERDPLVATAFADVSDLLAPPRHILAPRVLWRVLRGNLARTSERRPPSAAGAVAGRVS